jgi:hypothetical protein
VLALLAITMSHDFTFMVNVRRRKPCNDFQQVLFKCRLQQRKSGKLCYNHRISGPVSGFAVGKLPSSIRGAYNFAAFKRFFDCMWLIDYVVSSSVCSPPDSKIVQSRRCHTPADVIG